MQKMIDDEIANGTTNRPRRKPRHLRHQRRLKSRNLLRRQLQHQHQMQEEQAKRRRYLRLLLRFRNNKRSYGDGKRKRHVLRPKRKPGKRNSDEKRRKKRSGEPKPRH